MYGVQLGKTTQVILIHIYHFENVHTVRGLKLKEGKKKRKKEKKKCLLYSK